MQKLEFFLKNKLIETLHLDLRLIFAESFAILLVEFLRDLLQIIEGVLVNFRLLNTLAFNEVEGLMTHGNSIAADSILGAFNAALQQLNLHIFLAIAVIIEKSLADTAMTRTIINLIDNQQDRDNSHYSNQFLRPVLQIGQPVLIEPVGSFCL